MPCGALNHSREKVSSSGNSSPHMTPRHPLVVLGFFALLLGSCSKPSPSAQTTTPDTSKVVTTFNAPPTLDRADKARIMGSPAAKVWLVIASDFQCPFCKQFHDGAYKQIVANYVATGKVRMAYLNYPGSMHVHATVSAEAAMCAGMQDKFWPMHDALFNSQEQWAALADPKPVFDSLAKALPVRMDSWRGCMASHTTRLMIDADHARAVAGGVNGTPNFFIANKLVIKGLGPYAVYRDSLDAALARAGVPSGGGRGGQ